MQTGFSIYLSVPFTFQSPLTSKKLKRLNCEVAIKQKEAFI